MQTRNDAQNIAVKKEQHFEWNLSANAQYTYNSLLFNLAVLKEDGATCLESILNVNSLITNENLRPDAEWYIDASTFLYHNQEKEFAQSILESANKDYPENTTLMLLYAEASASVQKQFNAISALENFYATHKDNEDIRLELIKAYIANNQFSEAEDLIKSIPQKEQNDIIHYFYGKVAYGLQKLPLAITQFSKVIQMNPRFVEAYAELAYVYELQKEYAKAENTYKGLIELEGNNIGLWIRIIDMNMKLKKPETAYSMVMQGAKALESENSSAAIELMLRTTHFFLEAEYVDQAKKILHTMEQRYPNQEVDYLLGAIAYEQDNNLQEALKYFEKIDVTSEYHKPALRLRAQIYYELGQRKTALEIIEHAIQLYPSDKVFHDMRIQLYINEHEHGKALSSTEDALTIWPMESAFLSRHGSILGMMGRLDEAFVSMEKALEADPNDSTALNYVAYMLAEKNEDLARAHDYAQKAITLDPENGHIMDTVAWVQYKLGDFATALITIKKALALGADEAEIWEHYGDIALANGDANLARKAYTTAINKKPDNEAEITTKLQKLER